MPAHHDRPCPVCEQALAQGIGEGPPCPVTHRLVAPEGGHVEDLEGGRHSSLAVCGQCEEWLLEGMPMGIFSERLAA